MHDEDEDTRVYDVVVNHEEQYSIWLKGREIPHGWAAVGKSGLKAECLEYIEEVWTDMRPLSLRNHMESFSAAGETTLQSSVEAASDSDAGQSPNSA